MTIYNKTVSRQKLHFAGNIASKGKRAIFPANVEIYFFLVLGSLETACLLLY